MSGSSSGGGGGGFGSSDSGTDCQKLRFGATLQSPQPDAVEAIVIGEVLDVVLVGGAGTTPVIEVQRSDGTTVGALIDHVTELLRCLQDDFQFVAEVLEISGGAVRVSVHAR
jgi:hypothetical protein